MKEKLYKLVLQESLELNGIAYEPDTEVEIPEWLYDQLVDKYTSNKEINTL